MIEDDSALRELVTILLDEANLSVEAWPLDWNAHHCIRTNLPKVVILDVQMPIINGIQLFHVLRADPRTRHIPVIFLTANPETVRLEVPNYQDLGAALLSKPFDIRELLELVRTVVAA